jgi:hypothetical protein
VSRKKIASLTALDVEFGLIIFLGLMPFPNSDVALVRFVIKIVKVFPVFAIIVTGPVNGLAIVLGEDSVPNQGGAIVDVDGKRGEVFLNSIKVKTSKNMSSDIFIWVIIVSFIILLNIVSNKSVGLRDDLIQRIVTPRPVRMMDE